MKPYDYSTDWKTPLIITAAIFLFLLLNINTPIPPKFKEGNVKVVGIEQSNSLLSSTKYYIAENDKGERFRIQELSGGPILLVGETWPVEMDHGALYFKRLRRATRE